MKKLLTAALALTLSACVSTSNDENTVTIYINSGAVQCESSGKTAAETALLLNEQGIEVRASLCGSLTNLAVIAMCGAGTTDINLHLIGQSDLSSAQDLGFENVESLKLENDPGYQGADCK
ncbi:hypothetical protein [Psychromonas aquimarina]|uniref:hypothetical protein n=1 Tax=Psychromonas aquimarina TaxID=444919 RepID=UPI00041FA763|nr:hypothetical protein [Psychromonas aquimarina]